MPGLNHLLRIALAVLLLAAWQVALLHPIKHLNAGGSFVHVAGTHSDSDAKKKSAADPLCDAIAAVGICVGGSPWIAPPPAVAQFSFPDFTSGRAQSAALLAYRSQAPPSLL